MSSQLPAARAVIYLRVSTKDQAAKGGELEGYSIPAQRLACLNKAKSLDVVVIEQFVDAGESARSADRRQLQRMLKFIEAEPVQYVIVHKVDRLARNRMDDLMINLALEKAGAQLVSCAENIDQTPSGKLMHGIMSSIAEFYSRNLANEVVKGMQQKVRSGGTVSRAPVGYINSIKTIEGKPVKTVTLDPVRAPLIHWAFAAYASGEYSLHRLCNELALKGLTQLPFGPHPERPIPYNTLSKIFKNPYYTGRMIWKGVEYRGTHPALVDEALFIKVQQMLDAHNTSGERAYRSTHYLKGSLRCEECKSRVTYSISTNRRNGVKFPYFFCLGRHENPASCSLPYITEELIEQKVLETVMSEPIPAEVIEPLKAQLLQDLANRYQENEKEQHELKSHIQKLNKKRYMWAEKALSGAVPDDIAREKQQMIAGQLEHAQSELNQFQLDYNRAKIGIEKMCAIVEDFGNQYASASPKLRRLLNQALFTSFEVAMENDGHGPYYRVTPQRQPFFEILKTARFVTAAKEKYHQVSGGIYSLLNGSRVDTLVISRRIELRLPG